MSILKPTILIAMPNTIDVKGDDYTFFVSREGERILCCHGSPDGSFPVRSQKAINKFNPDKIYCCYPKRVRRNTGDNRIQGMHDSETECFRRALPDNGFIIMVKEVKR